MAGGAGVNDRYQSGLGFVGVMDTERWFAALLGASTDHSATCSTSAAPKGRKRRRSEPRHPRAAGARSVLDAHRTVIMSQIIHWLGRRATRSGSSWPRRATSRSSSELANDHYAIPENGTWFPTLTELDAMVGGVRTSETHLMTQDNGKEIWAATYRTDLRPRSEGEMVVKNGRIASRSTTASTSTATSPSAPPRISRSLRLSGPNATAVRDLARKVAEGALADGTYPSDFSPRNVIVDDRRRRAGRPSEADRRRARGATAPGDGRGARVPADLAVHPAAYSSIGLDFTGDLRSLL
jgi:hypothetical protein